MAGCAYIDSVSTGHGLWPSRVTAEGSANVIVNGKGAARIGDSISCGGNIATGGGNVLVGD